MKFVRNITPQNVQISKWFSVTHSIYKVFLFIHNVVEIPFLDPIIEMFFSRVPFIKGFFDQSVVKMPFHVPIIKRSNYENQNVYKA